MSALEIHPHFTPATFYEDKVDVDLPALRLKQHHAEFGIHLKIYTCCLSRLDGKTSKNSRVFSCS